jgi:hypothetical protein
VVPGENKLVLEDAVMLLPLVSLLFPSVAIGDAGIMFEPEDWFPFPFKGALLAKA